MADRSVVSDTRFSRGMWELKEDVKIGWAQSSFKTEIKEDGSIYNMAATTPLRNRGDQLNNPTISTTVHSPAEGVIGLEHYHWYSKYVNNKEPRFKLNTSEGSTHFKSTSDDKIASLAVDGSVQATVQKNNFGIDFVNTENGKLLTKLGFRSVGWASDSRYKQKDGLPSSYITFQLHISNGEKFFGLGERFGPYVKNGQRVEIWNEDGGTCSEYTYKNIPFYISNRGYGVFVDSSSDVIFEIQSERTTRVNITVPGEGARYYIIHGPDPKTILERYAKLTGYPALPPPWTFGLWLTTSFTTDYDIGTVSSFIKGMKDRDIPLRTFHFDCYWMKGFQWCDFEFDPEYFPDPAKLLAGLKKDYGINVCVWINSYIGQESSLFKDADKNGYLIKNLDDTSYQTDLWQAGMGIVDFTNPDAVKWFQSHLERLVDIGVDCFKTDFGERIPIHGVKYHDGSDPVAMHNYYTLLYNKCVFEVLEKKFGKHKATLFARSATVGSQQYPVHWGGDSESTFEALAEEIRGGLSFALSGFGFWSHDISGFEGYDLPDPALYKRWVAFGLLSSHSRLHGSQTYRVPWLYDEESVDVLRFFTKLKLSLMPYIYNIAIEAHTKAVPVLRPLLLEFFNDITAVQQDNEFLLGDKFLVAPVADASNEITYYVPKGDWYGYLDGKVRASQGEYFTETHDFKSLPFLVRPNSVFVSSGLDAPNDKPDYDYTENVLVNIYGLEDGETVVKIPNYENLGEFSSSVKITKSDKVYKVETESSFKKFAVRLLNVKDVKESSGNIANDDLGNIVVSSSDKEITIAL